MLALGGNALARAGEPATITNQFRHARESMAMVVELARAGWRIVLVHGNGPQVGDELVRNEARPAPDRAAAARCARGGDGRLDRLHAAAVAAERARGGRGCRATSSRW